MTNLENMKPNYDSQRNAARLLRIYDAAIGKMVAEKLLVLNPEHVEAEIRAEGLTRSEVTAQAISLLRTSAGNLNGDEVEALLMLAGHLHEMEDGVTVLNTLLPLRNHTSHEDIVRSLQAAAAPSSVPPLISIIESGQSFAPWDDGTALVRKCFWALAAIGTENAWRAIERYSSSGDSKITQAANEQLERRKV